MNRGVFLAAWWLLASCASPPPQPVVAPLAAPAGFEGVLLEPDPTTNPDSFLARDSAVASSRTLAEQQARANAASRMAARRQRIRSEFISRWRVSTRGTATTYEEDAQMQIAASSDTDLRELRARVVGAVEQGGQHLVWLELACPERVLAPERRLERCLDERWPLPKTLQLAAQYEAEGHLPLARRTLDLATDREPTGSAWEALAEFHHRHGDERAARQAWQRLSDLGTAEPARVAKAREQIHAIDHRLPTTAELVREFLILARECESRSEVTTSVAGTASETASFRWQLSDQERPLVMRLGQDFAPNVADEGAVRVLVPRQSHAVTFLIFGLPANAPVWETANSFRGRALPAAGDGAPDDRARLRQLLDALRGAAPSAKVVEFR